MAVAGSVKPVPYLDNIPYVSKRKSRRLLGRWAESRPIALLRISNSPTGRLIPFGVQIIGIINCDLFLRSPLNNAPKQQPHIRQRLTVSVLGRATCYATQMLHNAKQSYQYCSSKILAAAFPLSPGAPSSCKNRSRLSWICE